MKYFSGDRWFKIWKFVIVMNIVCVLIIIYLIYDLSNKRILNQEFWNKLESLYFWQKNYENRWLWICWYDEQIIELKLKEWEKLDKEISKRWFFYNTLLQTFESWAKKRKVEKNEFDYSQSYKKDEVKLWLQEIKQMINNFWKQQQDINTMTKYQADEIVNLWTLYYDHLFWSLFKNKETISIWIEKHKVFKLILKNWNEQTKIISYISKWTNSEWKDEVLVNFFDLSDFWKEDNERQIEQFSITERKDWNYKLKYNWEISIITKKSKNYDTISLLFDFQNIITCFSLKITNND